MKGILPLYERWFRICLKSVSILSFILLYSSCLYAQPKTTLSFDGSSGRVDLPNILPASYTKEAWIYAPLDNGAVNNNNIVSGAATAFWFPGNQGFKLTAGHNSFPYNDVQDPNPLVANTWYHVAVTYDATTTTMTLYKNGVMVDQNASVLPANETSLYIGAFIGANYMKGNIDEVRIWSTALTQAEIRDWMCKKVTASHPQYASLLAYYKADDGSGTSLTDSKGANTGTLTGGVTWATSGAALGDASAYDYTNATKTASISAPLTGETFTATETSGTPDGIQVYRVDAVPDNTTGLVGIGGNNKYFGVFQVGGTNPTYTAVYDYGTFFGADETNYRLYKRTDNSAASWIDAGAAQDVNANTFTVTGQSTEYMLGSVGNPLPVNFLSFVVNKVRKGVNLTWSTAQEINNSGFIIQRSSDKGKNWADLGFVQGYNNTSSQAYNFLDENPVKGLNLYRLKQTDFDGNFKLSEIRAINYLISSGITIYPVPASTEIFIDLGKTTLLNTNLRVLDAQGRQVKQVLLSQLQQRIIISDLQKGIYMLLFRDGSSSKLIKQ